MTPDRWAASDLEAELAATERDVEAVGLGPAHAVELGDAFALDVPALDTPALDDALDDAPILDDPSGDDAPASSDAPTDAPTILDDASALDDAPALDTPPDAPDPCEALTDCGTCASTPGCGWCYRFRPLPQCRGEGRMPDGCLWITDERTCG